MLIDVLRYIIEADGSGASNELDRVGKKADNLESALNGVDETSKKTSLSLATMAKAAIGSFLSWQALSGAIASASGQARMINDIGNAADRIGESVESVDAFGRAIQSIGGDSSAAIQSMESLSTTVTSMLRGLDVESGKTFGFLGVSLKDAAGNVKGTTDLMLELSDAVQGMSTADATFHLNKLGIGDPKTIEAMLRGRSELERLIGIQKQNGTITKEQVENSRKFNESMGMLKTTVDAAGRSFTNSLMPYVQAGIDVLTRLVNWVKENQTLVAGFFIGVGAAVALYFLPPMAAAAASVLVAIAPILLMVAAVAAIGAAFALAYEDVMTFIAGGESLIGKIFDKFPAFKELVFSLVDAFKAVGSAIGKFFEAPLENAMKLFDWIGEKLNTLQGFGGGIIKKLLGGDVDVTAAIQTGQSQMAAASASPLNAMTSNAISNTSNNTRSSSLTIGEVRVETQATDAQGVADSLGTELQQQLKSFESYNQTAVAG